MLTTAKDKLTNLTSVNRLWKRDGTGQDLGEFADALVARAHVGVHVGELVLPLHVQNQVAWSKSTSYVS